MFGLNKVPDLSSDGGDRKSGVTREPISIFSQIKNANDEEKKKGLTQLLETLKKNLPEGFKIGAAVSAGDCFFDSVAQGLNELKGKGPITSDEGFNVKSLRKDCANDARKYEDKIVKDANECGYFVPQKNIVFPHLENIKDKKGNDVPDVQETFDKYLDYIKNVATENGPIPIWGKLNIEGRMICDKYKVKIKVIELKEQPIGDTNVIESEEGEGTNVITMVNYKNHFVPLLSNIEKDIEESKEVPREEVYGNVVNSHRETSSLQNIGNSLPRKQSSMFHARGPDKENRPSEDVSPSKFISETLDKENYTEWLKQEDIARIADLQYGWHGENNNIIFDVLGSLEQLNSQLEQHQERLKNLNKQSLTYIINLGNCHWVTLVITYHNQRFLAYYIDSFGKSAEEGLLGQKNINISSLSINQQSDGYNCGIFALENARIINEGISSSETKNFKQKLGEMQLSKQQLEDMRRKFADLLQRNNTSLLDNDQLNDQIYTSCDEPDDESEKGKKRSALRNIMNLQEAIEQESLRNKENHAPNPINGGQRSGSISEIQRKSSRLKERTSTKSRNKESNVSAKSPLDQSSIELAQASQPVISLSKRKLGTEENDPTDKKRLRSNSFSLGDNNPAVYKSEREINILLEIFTEKFVEVFQEKLKDYSGRIIEKKEKQSSILSKLISLGFIGGGVKTASSVMSADLSRLSSATIGSITLLSSGVIDSLANKCIQAFQNQGAAKVARNTINFQVSKSQFREVLVRASVNVFKNYENQYLEMIFKGELGQKLGVEVLAYVAVQRAISYIKSQEDDIQAEVPEQYLEELYTLITKGVVLENSKVRNLKKKIEKNFHKAFLKFCSTVSSKKKDFHDLYDENMYNATGLVDVASDGAVNQYYTRQDGTSDTKKYGYRLAFEWELKNALDGWSPEENIRHTQYKYILKPEEIVHKVEQISRKVDEKSQVSKSDFQEMKDILMEIKGKLDSLHDAYPVQVSTNLVKNDVQGSGLLNEIEELKEDILKISDEKQKDDIRELETKLSVSVALHLAIAYIHQEKEKFKKRGGTKSWVSDYLKKLQEENLYGSKIQFKVNHDVKIVAAACNIILKKIKEREDLGIKALEIIEIMAYLDSDGVSIEEVFLQSASNKKEKLWSSIELLEKYSLIHLESGQSSIRKLVQEAIKLKLRIEGREEEVLKKVLQLEINIADTSQANSIVSIWSCYVSECKEFLIQFDNFSDKSRNSLLSLLIARGQPQVAERILHDVDDEILKRITEHVDEIGNTFLHFVATHNALGIVKYLIDEKEVKFNIKNIYKISPLISATYNNAVGVVEYLIKDKNANNLEDLTYSMILNIAAYGNALNVIKYLEGKNFISFESSHCTIGCLHSAICNNALDVVKYLIEDKDVLNSNQPYHYTSLMNLAAYSNALSVMKYLIEKTVSSSNISRGNIMQLNFLAACGNAPDIIRYLTEEIKEIFFFNLYDSSFLLQVAAYNNALDVVKYLIDKGVDFNAKDYNGETLLYFSIKNDIPNVVKYLIEDKKAVDLKNQEDSTDLLSLATKNNALDVIKYLIDEGVDFNAKDYDGETLLYFSIKNDIPNVVKYLIEDKKAVDLKNQEDSTDLLSLATKNNALDVIKYLIDEGVDFNAKDYDGETLLYFSIKNDIPNVVKYLIEDKKAVDLKNQEDSTDLLSLATKNNALDVIKYLIEDKNAIDFEKNPEAGRSLLSLALENKALDVAEYLIDKVVNFNSLNDCDRAILSYVNENNAPIIVKCLDKKGCVEVPINFAARNNILGMVKYLIENKKVVDLEKNPEAGRYLLDVATSGDASGVVKYLIDKGVDFSPTYDNSDTLLHRAITQDAIAVVKYLIEEKKEIDLEKNSADANELLDLAINSGTLKIVKYLIEEKKVVDLNKNLDDGRALLDLAVESQMGIVAQYLIKVLNIKKKPDDAKTLFRLAIKNDMASIVEHLVDVVDLNNQDDVKCFLDLALRNDARNVVEYLVQDKGIIDLNNSNDAKDLLKSAVGSNARDVVEYLIEYAKMVDLNKSIDANDLLCDAIKYTVPNVVGHLAGRKVNFITAYDYRKISLDLAQEKLAEEQENEGLKRSCVYSTELKEGKQIPFETNNEIDDNPETYLSNATIDNQLTRSPSF